MLFEPGNMIRKHAGLFALFLLSGVSGCDDGGNQAPDAAFSTTPASGIAPVDITCNASASFDADGSVSQYLWDFGDGQVGTGVAITHTYTSPGTYTVTLTVVDDKGAKDAMLRKITVAANQPPTAAFTAAPSSGFAPLDVGFDAGTSLDSDGTIAQYSWDFGDGGTGVGISISHTYTTGGPFVATLTVTDNGGATDTATRDIAVKAVAAVTVSWVPNRESAVNSPGGGYHVYYDTAPEIDITGADVVEVPYISGPTAPTTAVVMLPGGTYYFKVAAYSALNSGGSEPSQEVSITVP